MKRLLSKPLGLSVCLSLCLAGAMFLGATRYVEPLERFFLQVNFRNVPETYPFTPEIAMVEINDLSVHSHKRWPWTLREVATLLKKIGESNPKAVVLALPLLDESAPENRADLRKALEQFNQLHPPPARETKTSETKDNNKRRKKRRPPSRREEEQRKKQAAEQKKVEELRKLIELSGDNQGKKELLAALQKIPKLVLGYIYYKEQSDVPGVDVAFFQKRDLELKKAEEAAKEAKPGKSSVPAKLSLDQLFQPLGKARYLSGSEGADPAPAVYGLRGNPALAPLTRHHGFINVGYSPHDVVKKLPLFVKRGDRTYPSIALAAYVATNEEPTRLVGKHGYVSLEMSGKEFPLTPTGELFLNYYGTRAKIAPKRRLLAGDILAGQDFQPKTLENKIVLVGLSSGSAEHRYATPVGQPYSALELQATLLANLLQRRTLDRPPMRSFVEMGILLVTGLLLGVLLIKLRWFGGLFVTLLLIAGLHLFNLYYLFPEGDWYKLAYIDLSLLLIFVAVNWVRDITVGHLRQQTQARFEESINVEDFAQIVHAPEKLPLDGLSRSVTVLSGKSVPLGSHLNETHDPKRMVRLLRHVNEAMTDVVRRNHGMIRVLDGHLYQVLFNTPTEYKNHLEQACITAMQMQFEWEAFVPRWQQEHMPVPRLSLGLDSGTGIVGNFGGSNRFIYSYLGSPVEYSELLQELNRYYGSRILLSENLYLQIKDNPQFLIRELDKIEIAEEQPVITVYELLGTPSTQSPLVDVIQWYHQGLQYYRSRNFQEAIRYFQEISRIRPQDGPAYTMLQRSQNYLHYPPSFQWDGSWKLPPGQSK